MFHWNSLISGAHLIVFLVYLHDHQHSQFWSIFITSKKSPVPFTCYLPIPLHPPVLSTTNLLSLCLDLFVLDISDKLNHTAYNHLCLAFSLIRMFLRFIHIVTCISHYLAVCLVPQSCPILCNSMDCNSPGSHVPRDSPGRNTEVGCHALQGIFLTHVSRIAGRFFTVWVTMKPISHYYLWPNCIWVHAYTTFCLFIHLMAIWAFLPLVCNEWCIMTLACKHLCVLLWFLWVYT